MIKGFDVSRWEIVKDWSAIRAAGFLFGGTRCFVGGYYEDPTFRGRDPHPSDGKRYNYWQGMKDAGILRMAYHVVAPERPKEQINKFIDILQGDVGELPPVLDVELDRGQSKETITECVRHAVVEIQARLHTTPIIYTRKYFVRDHLNRHPVIEACPLWVANYTTAASPAMPVGWKTWTFWQYTESGRLPGVKEAVDLNRFNGTEDELNALASGVVPLPLMTWEQAIDQWARGMGYTGPGPG